MLFEGMADRGFRRGYGGPVLATRYGSHPANPAESQVRREGAGRALQDEAPDGGDMRLGRTRTTILQRQFHIAQDRRAGEEHQVQEPRLRRTGQQEVHRRHLPRENSRLRRQDLGGCADNHHLLSQSRT
jgi:hypothetical protein